MHLNNKCKTKICFIYIIYFYKNQCLFIYYFFTETYNASLRQQARVDSLTSNATGSLTK